MRQSHILATPSRIVLLLASLAIGADASASKWTSSASVGASMVLADQGSFSGGNDLYSYLAVTPRVGFNGKGARATLRLSYGATLGRALTGGSSQRISHRLNAGANLELVRNTVFVDVRANAGMVARTADGLTLASSDDLEGDLDSDPVSILDNDNQSQTFSLSISPRSRHRLAGGLILTTHLGISSLRHGNGNTGGGSLQSFNATLNNSGLGRPLVWSTSLRTQLSQGNGVNSSGASRSRIGVNLSYRRNATWSLRGGIGFELNDVNSNRSNTNGLSPTIGFSWTPNRRTQLNATLTKRYFGYSANLVASHSTRRTRLALRYNRSLSNVQTQLLGVQFIPLVDEFGEAIIDPETGDPVELPVLLPSLIGEDFISDSVSLTAQMTGRRTRISTLLRFVDRSYEVSDFSESSYLVRAGITRQLGKGVSARASASYQVYMRDDTDNQRADLILGFSRRVGKRSSASVNYRHSRRMPDGSATQVVNRVSLTFRTTLR